MLRNTANAPMPSQTNAKKWLHEFALSGSVPCKSPLACLKPGFELLRTQRADCLPALRRLGSARLFWLSLSCPINFELPSA